MSEQNDNLANSLSLSALLEQSFTFRTQSGKGLNGTLQRVLVSVDRKNVSHMEHDRAERSELKRNCQRFFRDISGQTFAATENPSDAPTGAQTRLWKEILQDGAYTYVARIHEARVRTKASPLEALAAQIATGQRDMDGAVDMLRQLVAAATGAADAEDTEDPDEDA